MTAVLDPGRPFAGGERQLLESTLDLQRAELVAAVEGLTDSQARQKLVPSLTTPISLINHCAAAERIWFQRTLAGIDADNCDGHAVGVTAAFMYPPRKPSPMSSLNTLPHARSRGRSPRPTTWTTPSNTAWSGPSAYGSSTWA
jgi:hypothetical protein